MSLNDWIKLDVGGRILKTTRGTLMTCPDSKLANMFSLESSWPADAVSQDGVFKIDADPNVFEILLNWLRYKKVMMTYGISLESVAVVAETFGLIDLQDAVEEQKKLTQTKTVRVLGLNDNTEKGIIEEMGLVCNFLKNAQIQNEDLSVIKKPLNDLMSSLKYIPNGKHFNILPEELKMNILSYLEDLNALHAASVCEEWEGMLKNSWRIDEIFDEWNHDVDLKDVDPGVLARALNEVEFVQIDKKLTSEQITGFFAHLSRQDTKLKMLTFAKALNKQTNKLSGLDLSHVKTEDLVNSVNKLEEVVLLSASLTTQQVTAILRHILNNDTKLKKLYLSSNNLSGVSSDDLTTAVNKLEKVGLYSTSLTTPQASGILRHIVNKDTKLKKLCLSRNNLSGVSSDDLATAINKLECAGLLSASLTTPQLTGILSHIVNRETKLKTLGLAGNDLSGVEEDLLNSAKNKLSQSGGGIVLCECCW